MKESRKLVDFSIVNGGNGFIDVTGRVTMKMLNNIFFLLSLLYDSGNSLLYNNKTGECIGFATAGNRATRTAMVRSMVGW